jgi:hypothetical protein
VPRATKTAKPPTEQNAKGQDKDLMTRLADAGEEALQRLTELPGSRRALNALNDLRARVDDLTKKVRGIDALEARVVKLEKEVAELKRPRRTSTTRRSAARKPAPPRSPGA